MNGIEITVNGRPRACGALSPQTRLLEWLRQEGLTGVKEGCAEGECGACAVMIARPDGGGRSRWTSVNSCLPPALAFDGQEIVTAEGLGREELHPVQEEMAARGGSQCGYCTPGFVCSMAAEFYRPERQRQEQGQAVSEPLKDASDQECGPNGFDLHALSGNLCRCTGYRPIRDAAFALKTPDASDPLVARQNQPAPEARPTRAALAGSEFTRPATLTELLRILEENPEATLVAGSTDIGVEVNLRHRRPAMSVAVDRLEELRGLHVSADRVEIGAGLTLTEVERGLAGRVSLLSQVFPQFASPLIRNAATFGGNLGTGSPIGDLAPALLALNASLVLVSARGEREVALCDYFTGYRQSVRQPGELIRTVNIPKPLSERTAFHKIAKRRFDDISSVAVAFALQLEGDVISSIRIGLGGVAATPIRAARTETALIGQPWSSGTVSGASNILSIEGTPIDDLRASAAYRSAMLGRSLHKFHAETTKLPAADEVSR